MTKKIQKEWRYRPAENPGLAAKLATSLGMPEVIGSLLLQRGIDSHAAAKSFLWPTLAELPSPLLMKGMDKAVQILGEAICEQRQIIIYGDYDVDGVTGMAVLALFLKDLGVSCHCCQPHRLQNGYGFSADLIKNATKDAVLVTVDCGISDVAEVARAKELGLSVIVTDHHQPPSELPAADAILNPIQPGCEFPYKHLAGVGVAFYLAMGLRGHLMKKNFFKEDCSAPNLKSFLDLVAIGTICDMTPLTGANRIMTIAGLEILASNKRPGLQYLLQIAGISGHHVSAEDIGYRVGPRLNAPGRLGDAGLALKLLMSEDAIEAKELAQMVDGINQERQELVRLVAEEAKGRAAKLVESGANSLVLHGKDWHGGVVGIVSSRLVGDFHRPTILLTYNKKGLLKGSGRSIPGFDLHQALTDCAELLESYGGHTAAVGLSLQPKNLDNFIARFEEIVSRRLDKEALQPLLWIDQVVSGKELNHEGFVKGYQRLAPFGMGNPAPVFAPAAEILLGNAKVVGGDHLKFTATFSGVNWSGIGFGFGGFLAKTEGRSALPAFTVQQNFFRGREEWQLNVVDILPPTST